MNANLTRNGVLPFLLLTLPMIVSAQPTVWTTSSLVRTGKTDAAGSGTQATLSAARGEYESFQIAIQGPSGGLTNVNASVSDLTGPGGAIIAKSNLALFREQYVYVSQSSPNWGGSNQPLGAGWYPDGLIPFNDPATGQPIQGAQIEAVPFNLGAATNQPIWVDIFVPRTSAAGQYTGTWTVTSDQGSTTGSIALTVWNFTLPLQASLKSAFLVYNSREIAADQELLRNRISPLHSDPSSQAELMSDFGLNLVGLPYYSGANFGNCTMGSPPSVSDLRSLVAAQQPGLLPLIYSADETNNCPALIPVIQQWGQNLHQAGIQNLVTMAPNSALLDDGTGSGRSAVDIWTVLPLGYDQSPSLNAAVLAKGDSIWSYNTLVQDAYSPKWEIDFSPINYRIQPGFISQSLGITGMLYWKADGWSADPWNQVNNTGAYSSGNYPGEGMLVYPGTQVGINGVAPSMRLKWLRDGIEDYEYVQMLKLAGQGAFALQQAAIAGPDWTNWTRDPNVIESVRLHLAQQLDQQTAPPAPTSPAPAAPPSGPPTVSFVANAADGSEGTPGVVVPGGYVSIYGANLAGASNPVAGSMPLPTTLNGTQVFLGSKPLALVYASSGQINAIIPQGYDPGSAFPLVVVNSGYSSAPVQVAIAGVQPAIYSWNSSGSGQGAVYIAGTYSMAAAFGANNRPATAGEYLTLYCNGLGAVAGPNGEAAPPSGTPAPGSPALATTRQITVSIGGIHQTAQFAGLAPGMVGVYQVNTQVPAGLSGDAVPVTITMTDPQNGGLIQSNTVTIALR